MEAVGRVSVQPGFFAPLPRGDGFDATIYVRADAAPDQVARALRAGMLRAQLVDDRGRELADRSALDAALVEDPGLELPDHISDVHLGPGGAFVLLDWAGSGPEFPSAVVRIITEELAAVGVTTATIGPVPLQLAASAVGRPYLALKARPAEPAPGLGRRSIPVTFDPALVAETVDEQAVLVVSDLDPLDATWAAERLRLRLALVDPDGHEHPDQASLAQAVGGNPPASAEVSAVLLSPLGPYLKIRSATRGFRTAVAKIAAEELAAGRAGQAHLVAVPSAGLDGRWATPWFQPDLRLRVDPDGQPLVAKRLLTVGDPVGRVGALVVSPLSPAVAAAALFRVARRLGSEPQGSPVEVSTVYFGPLGPYLVLDIPLGVPSPLPTVEALIAAELDRAHIAPAQILRLPDPMLIEYPPSAFLTMVDPEPPVLVRAVDRSGGAVTGQLDLPSDLFAQPGPLGRIALAIDCDEAAAAADALRRAAVSLSPIAGRVDAIARLAAGFAAEAALRSPARFAPSAGVEVWLEAERALAVVDGHGRLPDRLVRLLAAELNRGGVSDGRVHVLAEPFRPAPGARLVVRTT
jgi:hypothetical protein